MLKDHFPLLQIQLVDTVESLSPPMRMAVKPLCQYVSCSLQRIFQFCDEIALCFVTRTHMMREALLNFFEMSEISNTTNRD